MKKLMMTLMVCIMLLTTLSTNAQYYDEVKIDGTNTEYLAKMKAKGYVISEYLKSGNGAKLKKGYNELYVFWTPKTKIMSNVTVYFSSINNWYEIKQSYLDYKKLLTDKYGEPDPENVFEFFSNPYYEGDSYEMSALRLGKAHYFTFWQLDKTTHNVNIVLGIEKFAQVSIGYENPKNMEIKKKEQNELDKKVL